MPRYSVTRYFTYADRFEVMADSVEESVEKVDDWYERLTGPQPEPMMHCDPDCLPIVIPVEKNEFVDADGGLAYRITEAGEPEEEYSW